MIIGATDLAKEVLIVAEIGNNHEGSIALAEEMIGQAAQAGAGAVKFQAIIPERLVSSSQTERLQQLKKICLKLSDFEKLSQVSKKENVLFLATPFDLESVDFLEPLVPAYKIASGDNNFFPLLEAVALKGKPILLSTGLSTLDTVQSSVTFLEQICQGRQIAQQIALLHSVSSYPTSPQEANLLALQSLSKISSTIGYSDHTVGIEAAVLAIALGARIVEKHFSLKKGDSSFRDHALSASPSELKQLVERVKAATVLLGDGQKKIQKGEEPVLTEARRSIVARRPLKRATVLSWEDLDWLRPAGGLSPGQEELIIGKRLCRNIEAGQRIALEDVEHLQKESGSSVG